MTHDIRDFPVAFLAYDAEEEYDSSDSYDGDTIVGIEDWDSPPYNTNAIYNSNNSYNSGDLRPIYPRQNPNDPYSQQKHWKRT